MISNQIDLITYRRKQLKWTITYHPRPFGIFPTRLKTETLFHIYIAAIFVVIYPLIHRQDDSSILVHFELTSNPQNMSSIKKVVIIGAGGHLGPSILAAFDKDPNFTVSILSRKSSTQKFADHITVHRVSDDYPEAELLEAFKGQDAVISTIATASAGQQHSIIDAAIKAGVKRFVPSEFGSDTRNDKAMAILPQYFKGKADAVDYLKSKESTGLTWTAFVTGCFFEL